MRYAALIVTAMACGKSPTPPAMSDAPGTPTDAAIDATPFVPTESHALGMNDVSILLQLADAPDSDTTLARMAEAGDDLVPRDAFAQLVTTPGDLSATVAYDKFHITAVRFDLCDRVTPDPCPLDADGQIRVVFQPPTGFPNIVEDVGLEAFYPIPNADLPAVVNELRALARLYNFQTASPLAINQALAASNPPSSYHTRLRALVLHYAVAANVQRLLLSAISQTSQHPFVFRGLARTGGTLQPLAIPTITGTQQTVTLDEPEPTYDVVPAADVPAGTALAFDASSFAAAPAAMQVAALGALASADNPTQTGLATIQCVDCHASTYTSSFWFAENSIDPATIPNVFTSSRAISTMFGAPRSPDRMRGFGYYGTGQVISQRVANETAVVLDDIDARYPPAPTTTFLDAGVDAPPVVKHVFVTSDLLGAGFGASGDPLAAADAICATAATRGGLTGTYVAWLSTKATSALSRITGDGPWFLTDDVTMVFANKAAIASGPQAPIDHDESFARPPGSDSVWTGTGSDGLPSASDCNDWTNTTNVSGGMTGLRTQVSGEWTAFTNAGCNATQERLYCFEQ